MKRTAQSTIDRSGRLVIPKAIRERAGFRPGTQLEIRLHDGTVEISVVPRRVRIVSRGRLKVAVPDERAERLTAEQVRRVQRALRERR